MMQQQYNYKSLNRRTEEEMLKKAAEIYSYQGEMPKLIISIEDADNFIRSNEDYGSVIFAMLPDELLSNVEFWQKNLFQHTPQTVKGYLSCAPVEVMDNKEFISFVLEKWSGGPDLPLKLGPNLSDDKDWMVEEMKKTRYFSQDVVINRRSAKALFEDHQKEATIAYLLLSNCSKRLSNDVGFQFFGNQNCCIGERKYAVRAGNKLMQEKQFILKMLEINPFFYGTLYNPVSEFINDNEVTVKFLNCFGKFLKNGQVWEWGYIDGVSGSDVHSAKLFKKIYAAYIKVAQLRLDKGSDTIREKIFLKYANHLLKKANKPILKSKEGNQAFEKEMSNYFEDLLKQYNLSDPKHPDC